jgi:hypothetical protein
MDQETVIHFPIVGIDTQMGFDRQPIRKTRDGTYAQTCPVGVNVRGYDSGQDRSRGGSRPGTVKYLPVRPGNVQWITQDLNVIVFMASSAVG